MNFDTSLIWEVLKWGYVLAFGLYFVFAIIAYRQVELMNRTLNGSMELSFKIAAMVLVAVSGAVLVMSVLVL